MVILSRPCSLHHVLLELREVPVAQYPPADKHPVLDRLVDQDIVEANVVVKDPRLLPRIFVT